ncbi:MOSC domain-containing protein [Microbacterium sp. NPDC090281]|uniref:MOSC domain-containing protein n=1 Tax=Microbacterium sp. NPDC090281 TaxID=3364208 RepID=UPI0038131FAD
MDRSRVVLESIMRYPVKGLAGVPTHDSVRLDPGRGLRWDRAFAIARNDSTLDATGWRPREHFFHLARHEHLARISLGLVDADSDSPLLTVETSAGAASGGLGGSCPESDMPTIDSRTIDDLLRRTLGTDRDEPRLVATTSAGLWDWEHADLSLINLATLEELGREAGVRFDRRRVRGNFYLSGLKPFEEFELVGRRIRVGDVELEVFQPTDRCRATTIRPEEGVSDLNVPALLAARYGHAFCGVYARVVRGGTVRAGDEVRDTGAAALSAREGRPSWPRTARVVGRVEESDDVVSLWLTDPLDLLTTAAPGTHVQVHLPGAPTPNWRSYTISGTAPGRFRISVKRDGLVSGMLHDAYEVDEKMLVTGPHGVGNDDASRDLLVVSAGIGITPTLAVLRSRAAQGGTGRVRVMHSVRDAASLPLWAEACQAVAEIPDATAHLHVTRTDPPEHRGGFTAVGESIGAAALASAVAELDLDRADASVCGPTGFATDMRDLLTRLGFAPDRIRIDAFYSPASPEWGPPRTPRAELPLNVDSASESFVWEPAAGSLLNAAERAGLDWPSECRVGVCGTCVRTVTDGEFEYLNEPVFEPGPGRVVVCSAAPLTTLRLDEPLTPGLS